MKTASSSKPFLQSRLSKAFFITTVSGIAILILVLAFPGILPAGWLKNRLEPILGRALDCTVRIQSARITSFFPLTIRVSDVTIEKSRPESPAAGRLESASFGISLLDLARKRPYFSRIEIDGGTIDISPSSPPQAALPPVPVTGSPAAAFSMALTAQNAPPPNPPLVIESLSVSRGTINLNDPKRPEPLVFSDFSGEGGVTERRVTCRTLKTTIAGGSFTGDGEANFGRDATSFVLHGTLAEADFAVLFARPGGTFITGTGRLKLDLRGTHSPAGGGFEQVEGGGEAEIRDGSFPKIVLGTPSFSAPKVPALPEIPGRIGGISTGPVQDIIGGILPSAKPAEKKPASATPTTPPPAAGGEVVRFQSLAVKFKFDTGRLNLTDLICTLTPEHRATADGTVFYRENPARISFQVKIPAGYFIKKNAASLPILGTLGTDSLSNLLVPVNIDGTVAKPAVRVGNLPIPL